MKYLPFLLLFLACTPKAASLVDEDGTDWNARAAEYRDDPAALRDLVEGYEETKTEAQRLRQESSAYDNERSDLQQQLTNAEATAQEAYAEVETLRQELEAARNQPAPEPEEEMITDEPAAEVPGVVFQVQLGAYAEEENKVSGDMATGDALDLTDQNGMQKVVVSRFRNYRNAAALRDRLQIMGVTGAFVVAMNDGQRIDVQEALKISGQ